MRCVISYGSTSFPWLCFLLWNSAVRVHDSQAYRKMDVTRECVSCIFELKEILLSVQTGFSLVDAAVVCAIQCRPLTRRQTALPTQTSEVNSNTWVLNSWFDLHSPQKRFAIVFGNNTSTCFGYTTLVLRQHPGLTKGACLYFRAGWLHSSVSQRAVKGQFSRKLLVVNAKQHNTQLHRAVLNKMELDYFCSCCRLYTTPR